MPKTSVIVCADAVSGLRSQTRVEEPQPAREANQKGRPSLPSRADICLVPAQVLPLGRPLGTSRSLLQHVSHHRDDASVGPSVNSGINSRIEGSVNALVCDVWMGARGHGMAMAEALRYSRPILMACTKTIRRRLRQCPTNASTCSAWPMAS
jgi:hypothetical protein